MKYVAAMIIMLATVQWAVAEQVITLHDFLAIVQENHPFFQHESLSVAISEITRDQHISDQDWVITSTSYYTHQKPVTSGIGVPEEIDIVSGDIGLERIFWRTGGRLALSWTSDYTEQTVDDIIIPLLQDTIIMSAGPSRLYAHRLYLTYTQPLLQNLGGTLDRLKYDMDEYRVQMITLEVTENREAFLFNVASQFLNWVLITEQLDISRKRVALARKQFEQVQRRYQANLVDRLDVLRLEDALRIAEQSAVTLESHYHATQNELVVLSGYSALYDMSPEYDLYTFVSLPDVDSAITRLKAHSAVLQTLALQHMQLERLRNGYQEMLQPQLFFTIGAGLQSGHEEFQESFSLDKPDALIALDFRYPLGSGKAQSNIKRTDMELERIGEKIAEVTLEYEAALRNLLIRIRDMETILALNLEHIASAKAKTQEELRLYNQGRNLLSFVIESRDSEQQAQLIYAENAAQYHLLVLQYYALMDELIVRYGVKE